MFSLCQETHCWDFSNFSFDRSVLYPLLGHISDDHSEEKEADAKMLLDFCAVQKQLIQTHDSILKLYRDETGSTEEPWKGKSKELVSQRGKFVVKSFLKRGFLSNYETNRSREVFFISFILIVSLALFS